ncbi:hypothetical protein FPQ18DRAFT_421936 [Pyronema domesticum]|nr:hypothetical protein FPQ18DRAFT_421936 [Pyronema domesticum]
MEANRNDDQNSEAVPAHRSHPAEGQPVLASGNAIYNGRKHEDQIHAATRQYGIGGRLLAPQLAPVASSPFIPSTASHAFSEAARFSMSLIDPLLLAAPTGYQNRLFSGLASAPHGSTVIGTLVAGPVASGTAQQTPAHPPTTPSQSIVTASGARRPQAAPRARKPRAPRQTTTQDPAETSSGQSNASSVAAFPPGASSLSIGRMDPRIFPALTGLHNPLLDGLALATTGFVVIGSLVSVPVAFGSGVVPPRVSSTEGHQQEAPKRKRISQSKALPVSQPASCASGSPSDSTAEQPSKKKVHKAQNHLHSGLASAATGSMVIGTLFDGPVNASRSTQQTPVQI